MEYDEETFLEENDKLAGRVYITITVPDKEPTKSEVILIVQYKDGKIYKVWELVYPDYSKMEEFEGMVE